MLEHRGFRRKMSPISGFFRMFRLTAPLIILLYTNGGLAKIRSVHMYVMPWMFYFGGHCSPSSKLCHMCDMTIQPIMPMAIGNTNNFLQHQHTVTSYCSIALCILGYSSLIYVDSKSEGLFLETSFYGIYLQRSMIGTAVEVLKNHQNRFRDPICK